MKKEPSTKFWIIAVVVCLLIVVSGVQAVELVKIRNTISTGNIGRTSTVANTVSTTSSDNLQKNLQNLPQMVGGC